MVVDSEEKEQSEVEENLKLENKNLKQQLEKFKRVTANMHKELNARKLE